MLDFLINFPISNSLIAQENSSECYEIETDSFLSIKNQTVGAENIQILVIDKGNSESKEFSFIKSHFGDDVSVYNGVIESLNSIKELIKEQYFIYGWNNAKYELNAFEAFSRTREYMMRILRLFVCMKKVPV